LEEWGGGEVVKEVRGRWDVERMVILDQEWYMR
jgi:hypothetical protein